KTDFDTIIFDREEVLGYPNQIKIVANTFKEKGILFGFVELAEQKGDESLARLSEDYMVKVHSIPIEEMNTMNADKAVDRFVRAVKDRSIRHLYIHPFLRTEDESRIIDFNLNYLKEISKSLKEAGFIIGPASHPAGLRVDLALMIILSLGVLAGGIWLISYIWDMSPNFIAILFMLSFLSVLAFNALGLSVLCQKLSAFSAAVIFPTLAMVSIFPRDGRELKYNFKNVSKLFLQACAISFVGAILVVGLLADSRFMLGSQIFAGVKFAFVLPIMLILGYFLIQSVRSSQRITLKVLSENFKKVTAQPLTIMYAVLAVVALGALTVMLVRSGNTGLDEFSGERVVRAVLEKIFWVRPRTKEFLVGVPFLVLAIIYYLKRERTWLWVFGSIGMISQISILNTFCHIHSPLGISLLRTMYGLVLGFGVGWLYFYIAGKFMQWDKPVKRSAVKRRKKS
ncbi:MAG: DUF5693 family protein, partial [bacterium]